MRKLWIGVIGSLVMLVVLDFLAKAIVERKVAEAVQNRYQLAAEPEIDIHGFPFLAQAATRRLDDVGVSADTVQVAGVDLARAELRMRDVRIQSASSAVVDEVDAQALIPYPELARLADEVGSGGLSFDYGGAADVVAVRGVVEVLGREFDVVAFTEVKVDSSTLTMRTVRVEMEGEQANQSLVDAIGDQFDLAIRIPEMFDLVRLNSVSVRPDGVEVGLAGSDIGLG